MIILFKKKIYRHTSPHIGRNNFLHLLLSHEYIEHLTATKLVKWKLCRKLSGYRKQQQRIKIVNTVCKRKEKPKKKLQYLSSRRTKIGMLLANRSFILYIEPERAKKNTVSNH